MSPTPTTPLIVAIVSRASRTLRRLRRLHGGRGCQEMRAGALIEVERHRVSECRRRATVRVEMSATFIEVQLNARLRRPRSSVEMQMRFIGPASRTAPAAEHRRHQQSGIDARGRKQRRSAISQPRAQAVEEAVGDRLEVRCSLEGTDVKNCSYACLKSDWWTTELRPYR